MRKDEFTSEDCRDDEQQKRTVAVEEHGDDRSSADDDSGHKWTGTAVVALCCLQTAAPETGRSSAVERDSIAGSDHIVTVDAPVKSARLSFSQTTPRPFAAGRSHFFHVHAQINAPTTHPDVHLSLSLPPSRKPPRFLFSKSAAMYRNDTLSIYSLLIRK